MAIEHEAGGAVAPAISVIVPTLNEVRRLPALLRQLAAEAVSHEVIVVDGGSDDGKRRARRAPARRRYRAVAGRNSRPGR